MNATQLRQRYNALLRRGDAARLLKDCGFGRSTLEKWGTAPPGGKPIRRLIGENAKQFRYDREALLAAAQVAEA